MLPCSAAGGPCSLQRCLSCCPFWESAVVLFWDRIGILPRTREYTPQGRHRSVIPRSVIIVSVKTAYFAQKGPRRDKHTTPDRDAPKIGCRAGQQDQEDFGAEMSESRDALSQGNPVKSDQVETELFCSSSTRAEMSVFKRAARDTRLYQGQVKFC